MDLLKVIADLKDRLWKEHGNVLVQPFTQDEKHLTYYLGDLLERNGFKHETIEGRVFYTEKAAQQAFIAGLRLGAREADAIAETIVRDRIATAMAALGGAL